MSPARPFLALAAALASAAPAQDEPPGVAMTGEELRAFHTGRDLSGCYVDRPHDPEWREHMAADGALYDLERGRAEVGVWWIQEDQICFLYQDGRPAGPWCFTGRRRGPYHDFYSAETGALVTTTECEGEAIARRNERGEARWFS